MNNAILIGLLRHVLTTLGGIMVAKGMIDESSMVSAVGAISTLIGVVWSVAAKRGAIAGPGAMNGNNTIG